MSWTRWCNLLVCVGSALLLVGCAATQAIKSADPHAPVRKVDFTKAPELKAFAERAQQFGNEMYPKVCALLLDTSAQPPRQFDIILGPIKSHNTGEAHLQVRRIYINSDYLTNSPGRDEQFEKVLVHEMAHMATQFRNRPRFFWNSGPPINHWSESIADYAFYKLIGTNGWGCPECNLRFPHYTSGYTCGGAFLLYLESKHGTNLVRELSVALRKRSYSDSFFANTTGQSLEAAWAEFQKSAAFKPGAQRVFELQQALGYVNGQPHGNVEKRFKKLVAQHSDALTKHAMASANLDGKSVTDLPRLMALYLYFTQPGGTPEHLLSNLREQGALPGFDKSEKGRISTTIAFDVMATESFPITRTLTGSKANDTSTYHYVVGCAAEGTPWKLEKAWRTGPDGKLIEELPLH